MKKSLLFALTIVFSLILGNEGSAVEWRRFSEPLQDSKQLNRPVISISESMLRAGRRAATCGSACSLPIRWPQLSERPGGPPPVCIITPTSEARRLFFVNVLSNIARQRWELQPLFLCNFVLWKRIESAHPRIPLCWPSFFAKIRSWTNRYPPLLLEIVIVGGRPRSWSAALAKVNLDPELRRQIKFINTVQLREYTTDEQFPRKSEAKQALHDDAPQGMKRNAALSACTAPYVAHFDDDDFYNVIYVFVLPAFAVCHHSYLCLFHVFINRSYDREYECKPRMIRYNFPCVCSRYTTSITCCHTWSI